MLKIKLKYNLYVGPVNIFLFFNTALHGLPVC